MSRKPTPKNRKAISSKGHKSVTKNAQGNPTVELLGAYLEFACAQGRLASFDRWLSNELKSPRYKRLDVRTRGLVVQEAFAAMRFAPLAFFLEDAFGDLAQGFRWQSRKKLAPEKIVSRLGAMSAGGPGETRALERLLALEPEALYAWTSFVSKESRSAQSVDRAREDFAREALAALENSREPEALMLLSGFPVELKAELDRRARKSAWSPELTRVFVESHATQPALWLRLNAASREAEVLEELKEARLEPRAYQGAIRVSGKTSIYALESFKSGAFEIQDLASQQIGRALEARPGDRVWDCCAGEGGKTAQIVAALAGKGFVYASDKLERKLENLKLRIRRTGFSNIRLVAWDGTRAPEFGPEVSNHGGFDRVLVDAPCSSSGTWRRNPDAKLRLRNSEIEEMSKLQLTILEAASAKVRPGGRLVYGTCSWFVDENETVVESFLSRHPEFKLTSMSLHGSPAENSDTTFAAALVRKA